MDITSLWFLSFVGAALAWLSAVFTEVSARQAWRHTVHVRGRPYTLTADLPPAVRARLDVDARVALSVGWACLGFAFAFVRYLGR